MSLVPFYCPTFYYTVLLDVDGNFHKKKGTYLVFRFGFQKYNQIGIHFSTINYLQEVSCLILNRKFTHI